MLIHLKLSAAAAGTVTDKVRSENKSTGSTTAIKRKAGSPGATPRDNELYTRAWAIYSRARSRRVVRASSII
ncbi:MAG: hypothetical protein H0V76_07680 [Blastocatellia bacterium]|nr:hypothetical protein [Blastocatellia bacterium]